MLRKSFSKHHLHVIFKHSVSFCSFSKFNIGIITVLAIVPRNVKCILSARATAVVKKKKKSSTQPIIFTWGTQTSTMRMKTCATNSLRSFKVLTLGTIFPYYPQVKSMTCQFLIYFSLHLFGLLCSPWCEVAYVVTRNFNCEMEEKR